MHAYQIKLMKKAYIAMLENIYISKKKFIIKSTVENFRQHQLFEKTLKGIEELNIVKDHEDDFKPRTEYPDDSDMIKINVHDFLISTQKT